MPSSALPAAAPSTTTRSLARCFRPRRHKTHAPVVRKFGGSSPLPFPVLNTTTNLLECLIYTESRLMASIAISNVGAAIFPLSVKRMPRETESPPHRFHPRRYSPARVRSQSSSTRQSPSGPRWSGSRNSQDSILTTIAALPRSAYNLTGSVKTSPEIPNSPPS